MKKPTCCHCGGELKSSFEVFGCEFGIEAEHEEINFLFCENCHHTACMSCKNYEPAKKLVEVTIYSASKQLVEV